MLTTDSIHIEAPAVPSAFGDTAGRISARPQTPYQVLRSLPKDATPAQQDSAIQVWFQPGEIHYSERPDTLHLPGHGVGRNLKDVNLPQYYRESFFSNDTLLHPELEAGRYGVAGDPVAYAIGHDNVISCILIACFITAMPAMSVCRNFIAHQVKSLFYFTKTDHEHPATSSEIKALLLLAFQTVILLSLLYFFYARNYLADTFILSDDYMVIALIMAGFLAYFLIKPPVYSFVNLTFFNSKKNAQWLRLMLFLTAVEGILLYPAILLLSYFSISPRGIVYYSLICVFLVKIVAFYKCYVIFFRQNSLFLQIFLYFCALEIVPLFALWGGLEILIKALEINF